MATSRPISAAPTTCEVRGTVSRDQPFPGECLPGSTAGLQVLPTPEYWLQDWPCRDKWSTRSSPHSFRVSARTGDGVRPGERPADIPHTPLWVMFLRWKRFTV